MNRKKTTLALLFFSLVLSGKVLSTELTPEEELEVLILELEEDTVKSAEEYLKFSVEQSE